MIVDRFDEHSSLRKVRSRDKQLKDTSQAETKQQIVKNEAPTRCENLSTLRVSLMHDSSGTPKLRRFLIQQLYIKEFPNRDRINVELELPNGTLLIDSKNKRCFNCGNYSHYVFTPRNGILGWRLCWKHLSPEAIEILRSYYSWVHLVTESLTGLTKWDSMIEKK